MGTIFQNKQIAKFLGWEYQSNPEERFFGKFKKPNYGWIKENELGFDCCWNSLMEVVEKIEHLEKDNYKYAVSITSISVRVLHRGNRIIDLPIDDTKIEAVYQAVVEFIKWYNNQRIQDSIDVDSWSK